MTSTADCSLELLRLRRAIEEVDSIVVGAGAGLSTAAGFDYSGEEFRERFSDFIERYNIRDLYSGGFYPYRTREEFWAWWSRAIMMERYDTPVGKPYRDLLRILRGKDWFVITTNVDHQFQKAGFDKERLYYTQGDYGLFQCSVPCRQVTWDNEAEIRRMVAEQKDMRVPTELIPRCPYCGAPATTNLRIDDRFVEDAGWHAAEERYRRFLRHVGRRVLFLELGVGGNTPGIIKYPFWEMTWKNPGATYACINMGEAYCPEQIDERSILIDMDLAKALKRLASPSAAGEEGGDSRGDVRARQGRRIHRRRPPVQDDSDAPIGLGPYEAADGLPHLPLSGDHDDMPPAVPEAVVVVALHGAEFRRGLRERYPDYDSQLQ